MIKRYCLLFVLILSLALSGCDYFTGTAAGRILPPPVSAHSFEGKWQVIDALWHENFSYSEAEDWVDSFVQFAEDAIVFGGLLWDNPSYRIKRVIAETYLEDKNSAIMAPESSSRMADVVTIYASGKYLGEFMKFEETDIIFFVENNQLLLRKVSDSADSMLRETYQEAKSVSPESGYALSGVLIGLKSQTRYGDYAYRTIWIAASQSHIRPILEANNIFFPRMSGFWECFSMAVSDGETWGNVLIARSAFTRDPDPRRMEIEGGEEARAKPAEIIINYIGNDYVSAEHIEDNENRLVILPIDYMSSPENVKAIDLLGTNGSTSYENARARAIIALLNEQSDLSISDDHGESFGLLREKGHWKLMGRVNYLSLESKKYSDFDLRVIPPNRLVFYDTLALNWNKIKDRVPDAIDAFTSPDQSFAIVKTKNKLTVYPIDTEQLAVESLGEIEILEDETIVMAEWATAVYVNTWERAFLSYGARESGKN
jgi:hypothetical protein